MLEGRQIAGAGLAALAFVVIALLGAIATYIDNYYNGKRRAVVANDLRMRTYHHLQRLSLAITTLHQTGNLLRHDEPPIFRPFRASPRLRRLHILVDLLTIVAMLV